MTTPAEKYAAAKKTSHAARNAERDAMWALPEKERATALRRERARTLHGSKEVEVEFEIDSEDLEYLGYHHTDECGSTNLSIGEETPFQGLLKETTAARRELSDWHDREHGINLWSACPHLPCALLDTMFRETP